MARTRTTEAAPPPPEERGVQIEYVDTLPPVIDLRPPVDLTGPPAVDTRPLPELASFTSEALQRLIATAPTGQTVKGQIRNELQVILPATVEPTTEAITQWLREKQREKVPASTGELNIAVELLDGTLVKWFPGFQHPDRPDLAPDGSPVPGVPCPLDGRRRGAAASATPTPQGDEEQVVEVDDLTTTLENLTEKVESNIVEARRSGLEVDVPGEIIAQGRESIIDWIRTHLEDHSPDDGDTTNVGEWEETSRHSEDASHWVMPSDRQLQAFADRILAESAARGH